MSLRLRYKSRYTGILAGLLVIAALAYARPGDVRGDVWVIPPPHRNMQAFKLGDEINLAPITIPEGSRLDVRIEGSWAQPYVTADGHESPLIRDGKAYRLSLTPHESKTISLRAGLFFKKEWTLHIVDDENPTIQFTATPNATSHKFLRLPFEVSDDVGVTNIHLEIRPLDDDAAPAENFTFAGEVTNGHPVQSTQYLDLLRHPYAGRVVTGRLIAEDALGQKASSTTMRFTMPALYFNSGHAMLISTVRQHLANNPVSTEIALIMLSQLAENIKADDNDPTLFLLVQSAYFRLKMAEDKKAIQAVSDYLWNVAIYAKEAGPTLAAREAIRAIRELDGYLREPIKTDAIAGAYRAILKHVGEMGPAGKLASITNVAPDPRQVKAMALLELIAKQVDDAHYDLARRNLDQLVVIIEDVN